MGTSSTFSTSNTHVKYNTTVNQNSQNVSNNCSNVSVYVRSWRDNSGYTTYGSGTCYCKINGTTYSAAISPSQKITDSGINLFSKTLDIYHNNDRTKTLTCSAWIDMNTPLSSSEQSYSQNLSTIPRASKPTLSSSSVTMGNSVTIYTNRASSNFTHSLYYKIGSNSKVSIGTGIGTSKSWTVPLSLANNTPNSTSLSVKLWLETYNGSTYIGTNSVSLTANVPSSEGTSRKIIIENQLEYTNHEHLDKIITYASGKSANIIIWIVRHARDEHRQAIEWLNQHTDENINFSLIEIKLWKIGESLPAPKFNVVEQPNSFIESIKVEESLSETKKLQLKFWQAFKDYAFSKQEFRRVFSLRKAHPYHWFNLSVGNSSLHIDLTVNTQKNRLSAGIYIRDDKESFEKFNVYKEEIENEIWDKMEWKTANKDCRILISHDGNIKKESSWPKYFEWLCDNSLKLKEVIDRYII